jgi:hypothetical protein
MQKSQPVYGLALILALKLNIAFFILRKGEDLKTKNALSASRGGLFRIER